MRTRRSLLLCFGIATLGAALLYRITDPTPDLTRPTLSGDAERGEAVFWASGCASCHRAENSPDDILVLAGGQAFPSEFGVFYAPNISMDPTMGIGAWSEADFQRAVRAGISPGGAHYYPVFPYTAYALADAQDIADLWAFWQDLPSAADPSRPHEVSFPFSVRAGLGLWKRLHMASGPTGPAPSAQARRGRYLAEALAHCGECHTPRTSLGGLDRAKWLTGAPNPTGDGTIPGLTPDKLTWSSDEITSYFFDGFTPDFDSAGGHMVDVIRSLSKLPEDDRAALTAYLKALPSAAAGQR